MYVPVREVVDEGGEEGVEELGPWLQELYDRLLAQDGVPLQYTVHIPG